MDVYSYFERWNNLFSRPDWYVSVVPELKEIRKEIDATADVAVQDAQKKELYDFFEMKLREEKIALGNDVGYFDRERRPIDTIVIHHTSSVPGMTLERLSAIELIRLYAPYFAAPVEAPDQALKGKAIFSGHVRDNKQIFWPYHWIVRSDGLCERLLEDNETGWQAGKWDVNCRSVAIVFDNDYENSAPSEKELRVAAQLIKERYPHVPRENIIGHCEVNGKTSCPSNLFLPQWKAHFMSFL